MWELSVREKPVGGSLLPAASANPGDLAFGHRRLVLLFHGFNLSATAARKAYMEFARALEATSPAVRPAMSGLVGVLWPGDSGWGPLSFASFPTEIRPALESAHRVSQFLRTARGPGGTPVEIYLVGHSLGNRVAMELLLDVAGRPPTHAVVRGTCLMAAAVPVAMLGSRLAKAAALARTVTLYSSTDSVLHWAFPLGETLAGEGWMPQAVGLLGNPPGAWTERHPMRHADGKGYGHGDYWEGKEAGRHVARMLGAALERELPAEAVDARDLADRKPPERSLVSRELPRTRPFR